MMAPAISPELDIDALLRVQEMRGERWVNIIRLIFALAGLGMLGAAWDLNTSAANLGFLAQGLVMLAYCGVVYLLMWLRKDAYIGWLKHLSIVVDLAVVHSSFFITASNHSGVIEYYQGFFPLTIALWNLLAGLRFNVKAALWSAAVSTAMSGAVLWYTVAYGDGMIAIVSDHSVFGEKAINPGDEMMRIVFTTMPAFLGAVFARVTQGLIIRAEEASLHRARLEQEKERLSKYLSKDLAELVLGDPSMFELGGTRRHATILFSDIRNFTPLAERQEPEQVVQVLNEYFTEMVTIVFRYGGTLDKFLGDGLMAVFSVPFDLPHHELRAVVVALEMIEAVREFNLRHGLESSGAPPLSIGVGIATGAVVAGNIGSPERMEYTSIGDTVNFAARLESLNKSLGTHIIISEETWRAIRDRVPTRPLPPIKVKGKTGEPRLFAVDISEVDAEMLRALRTDVLSEFAPADLGRELSTGPLQVH